MAKAVKAIEVQHALGERVRNRDLDQTGVVVTIAVNGAGTWYYVATAGGMSIGWWHETDIDGAPKSLPPSKKRAQE
jgi:hypothetical protein